MAHELGIRQLRFRSNYWMRKIIAIKVMKRLIAVIADFFRKEWFLLIAVSTIALIILVFELL
jgi:hypothetical protein